MNPGDWRGDKLLPFFHLPASRPALPKMHTLLSTIAKVATNGFSRPHATRPTATPL